MERLEQPIDLSPPSVDLACVDQDIHLLLAGKCLFFSGSEYNYRWTGAEYSAGLYKLVPLPS